MHCQECLADVCWPNSKKCCLLFLVAGGCFEHFLFLFLGSDVQLVSGCVVSTWVVDGAGGALLWEGGVDLLGVTVF